MKNIFLLTLLFFGINTFAQKTPKVSKKDKIVKISTSEGDMVVYLYDCTPKHKANFLKLASEGFYNGTTFHRIIENFMIQGGDPNSKDSDINNDGQGGPGYTIPAEIVDTLSHKKGMLAAARMGDNVNPKRESSGSQFYIVQNQSGTPHLDKQYTVFGKVIEGIDVVDKIAKVSKDSRDRPTTNLTMKMEVIEMKKKDLNKKYNLNLPLK